MNKKKHSVLVVDNDQSISWVLDKALSGDGYVIDIAVNGKEALDKIEKKRYSLVVMDINMPVMDGLTALTKIRELADPPETIMITAHSNMENTVEAMKLGAFDYIVKPFDIDELLDLAESAIKKGASKAVEGSISLPQSSDRIIGDSQAMRDLFKILGRVASTDTSVLITGETGTGKDLFARAIHYHSVRKDGLFINVNCASIPSELLESELFGHVRGAFTGATDNRIGKCEQADGGTLFLDEIGAMRHDLQAKLLRFLQHSEFERVGASKTKKVDTRVIAATNADLSAMNSEGMFREDLYYRLMVVPIHIPPLRDRRSDIPMLAKYFVNNYNEKHGLSFKLTEEHVSTLESREWPGNVRELENYIQRMVVLQSDSLGIMDDISLDVPGRTSREDIDGIVSDIIESGHPDMLDVARERIEKPLLIKIMARLNNNQSEAAKMLGVSRNTLRKMLTNYALMPGDETS